MWWLQSEHVLSSFHADFANDTVVLGDPRMTVPIRVRNLTSLGIEQRLSLCYQVHGIAGQYFNLISDDCVSVNGHHVSAGVLFNVIGSITVRAVDMTGQCRNISVSAKGCSASVDDININTIYRARGISVRRYPNRVRIAVPNCANVDLVMWVICQNETFFGSNDAESFTVQAIKFVITRGFNLQERSHGIIGEYDQAGYNIIMYGIATVYRS